MHTIVAHSTLTLQSPEPPVRRRTSKGGKGNEEKDSLAKKKVKRLTRLDVRSTSATAATRAHIHTHTQTAAAGSAVPEDETRPLFSWPAALRQRGSAYMQTKRSVPVRLSHGALCLIARFTTEKGTCVSTEHTYTHTRSRGVLPKRWTYHKSEEKTSPCPFALAVDAACRRVDFHPPRPLIPSNNQYSTRSVTI